MGTFWTTFMAFIFGAGGLAIINILQERWKWKHERQAKKEDRAEDREDQLTEISRKLDEYMQEQSSFNARVTEKFRTMEEKDENQSRALMYVLLDRILYIGQSYIKHGSVTFDERRRLREMHDCYHNGLGGNGDADAIMQAVDQLPLRQE